MDTTSPSFVIAIILAIALTVLCALKIRMINKSRYYSNRDNMLLCNIFFLRINNWLLTPLKISLN